MGSPLIAYNGDHAEIVSLILSISPADRERGETDLYWLMRKQQYKLRRALGEHDGEDRFHDAYIAVLQAIRKGDIQSPPRLVGYIRTVIGFQIAAHIKKAKRDREHTVPLDDTLRALLQDRGADPEAAFLCAEAREVVDVAMEKLRPLDRDILVRFYLKGESKEQIGAALDLNATQFRVIKSRAKITATKHGQTARKRRALERLAKQAA